MLSTRSKLRQYGSSRWSESLEQHIIVPLLLVLLYARGSDADCFGAIFQTIGSGFKYRAYLNDSLCAPNSTRVTRPYVAGACSRRHNNNFDGYPPACPPGDWNVMDSSTSTCERIFATALPRDIRTPSGDLPFDHGKVCNNGINSVIFVETSCLSLNASSVRMEQQALSDEYCWDGKMLSQGALAGIILGAIAGACIVISAPLLVYSWYQQKLARRRQASGRDIEAPGGKQCKQNDADFGFGLSSNSVEIIDSHTSSEEPYDVQLETESDDLGEGLGIPLSQIRPA